MHDDEYSVIEEQIEEQYHLLVQDVEKCHETINQLSARLDQQNVKIAEFVYKLSLAEVVALGVTVQDLLRSVRIMEEQLDDLMHFEKRRISGKRNLYENFRKPR